MKKTWFHYTVMIFTITILLAVPLQAALADGAGERAGARGRRHLPGGRAQPAGRAGLAALAAGAER